MRSVQFCRNKSDSAFVVCCFSGRAEVDNIKLTNAVNSAVVLIYAFYLANKLLCN